MALTQAEFHRLVDEHGPALYRMAYRLIGDGTEAEDIVQETFRSAWNSRHSFAIDRGERSWLATILRRRAADHWRRRRLPKPVSNEVEIGVVDADPSRDEYTDAVQHALNQLPQQLREALLLVVVGELTHQEAATALNVPLGTVLSRVARARDRLRRMLATVSDDDSLTPGL